MQNECQLCLQKLISDVNTCIEYCINLRVVEVTEVSEEEEEEEVLVWVGGQRVPYSQVTDAMVASMSLEEKSEYIRLGQEMYRHMYEWHPHGWTLDIHEEGE